MNVKANGNILSGRAFILVPIISNHQKTSVNEKVHQVSQHMRVDHHLYSLSHTTGGSQILGQRNRRNSCVPGRNDLSNRNYLSFMDQGKHTDNVWAVLPVVFRMLTGKSCILPALIYFITLTSFAQDLTIRKIVAAARDHQPVKFASVAIRNSNHGTYTNLSGEFSITCRSSDSLAISAVGYKKVIYSCRSLPDTILLNEEVLQLPEVVVSATKHKQHSISLGLYNKKRTGAYTGANAAALYIANAGHLDLHITKVLFLLSKLTWIYNKKPEFYKLLVRLKLYKRNAFYSGPGEAILPQDITEEVSEKQTSIVFNIDSLNITFPADGIFVAIEFPGYYSDGHFTPFNSNDQNKYIQYNAAFTNQSDTPASWIRLDYENDWRPLKTGDTVYNFNFGIEVTER